MISDGDAASMKCNDDDERRRRTTGDDDKNLGDTTSFYGRRVRQEQSAIYNDGTRARWQCDGDGDGVPVDGRVGERVGR